MGRLPIDGVFSRGRDSSDILVKFPRRFAIRAREDGGERWADGAVGACGRWRRVERVIAVGIHLSKYAGAIPVGSIELHGSDYACSGTRFWSLGEGPT